MRRLLLQSGFSEHTNTDPQVKISIIYKWTTEPGGRTMEALAACIAQLPLCQVHSAEGQSKSFEISHVFSHSKVFRTHF